MVVKSTTSGGRPEFWTCVMKGKKDDNTANDMLALTLHRGAAILALILCLLAGVVYLTHRSGQAPDQQETEVVE
jgi:hypothetical protein